MYYIKFVFNGKRWIKRVRGWDKACTYMDKLERHGLELVDWGTA